jgi:hypothetical protein
MPLPRSARSRSLFIRACCGACAIVVLIWASTSAQAEHLSSARRAFVDFHARVGSISFGHSFIVYGYVDERNKTITAKIAGFRPKSNGTVVDIVFPVPAKLGREREDLKIQSDVIYRRFLTSAEYRQLIAAIGRMKATETHWHLLFFNCNDFVGEVAEVLGLRRPPSSVALPINYIATLRALNR